MGAPFLVGVRRGMARGKSVDTVGEAPEVSRPAAKDVAAMATKLLGELQAVAEDEAAAEEKIAEVEEFLGSIRVADYPTLADSPIVQAFAEVFPAESVEEEWAAAVRRCASGRR